MHLTTRVDSIRACTVFFEEKVGQVLRLPTPDTCMYNIHLQAMGRNLNGFMDLFGQFLLDRTLGNKVDWSRIQPLPSGTVWCHISLHLTVFVMAEMLTFFLLSC